MRKNTKKSGNKKKKRTQGSWPVTCRWAAMGTLVAYTAFGASKVALAYPSEEHEKNREGTSEQQALVVRRFDISAGTLEEALGYFEKISEMRVKFSEEGLKVLHSPGLKGLYSADQALKLLLTDSGASYYFTSTDAVTIRLSSVSSSVEVSADTLQIYPSPKFTELLQDTPQTIDVISQKVMAEQGANTLRDALRNVADRAMVLRAVVCDCLLFCSDVLSVGQRSGVQNQRK